jgi:peptide deformylase
MAEDLKIVIYPDPRLRKVSKDVEKFDEGLTDLASRMFVLMREAKGVGLAAPQVGKNIRMFVMSHTGLEADDRVYVNPVLTEAEGDESAEEGCLSIPDIKADIPRSKTVKMTAQDLKGNPIAETQAGYIARVWQHEVDHLNGILHIDRMGALAKLAHRKALKVLEDKYAAGHPATAGKTRK